MAESHKTPTLDEAKKHELLALLSAGCSRRVAAAYVDCPPAAILTTARNDPRFAEALAHAENQAEIVYLQSIRRAAKQDRYWRAAAWVLERRNPQDYAPRPPNTVRIEEVAELIREIAVIVGDEVRLAEDRKNVLKQVDAMMKMYGMYVDKSLFEERESEAVQGN